jgi:hypothetical protein
LEERFFPDCFKSFTILHQGFETILAFSLKAQRPLFRAKYMIFTNISPAPLSLR